MIDEGYFRMIELRVLDYHGNRDDNSQWALLNGQSKDPKVS